MFFFLENFIYSYKIKKNLLSKYISSLTINENNIKTTCSSLHINMEGQKIIGRLVNFFILLILAAI